MQISVLIENNTSSELIAEHGLSLFIEYNQKKFLLDAGTTGDFLKNAEVMEVSLKETDCAVLSHGHYDHAGGFVQFLDRYENVKLYASKEIVNKYYSGSGGTIHEIGVPIELLEKYYDRLIFVEGVTKIDEDVYLVPHSTQDLYKIGERAKLYKSEDGQLVADDFKHEFSLVFDTDDGLVIFNSCTHAGIVNVIKEVIKVFGAKKIKAFIGGLHMKGKKDGKEICTFSEEQIMDIIGRLNEYRVEKLFTGHCTGDIAYELIEKHFGKKVERLVTGKRICL